MLYNLTYPLTADLGTAADLELYAGGSTPPTVSATKAKTGANSYRVAGTTSPWGLSFAAVPSIGAAMWLNHNGGAGTSGNGPRLFTLAVGNSLLRANWDLTDAQLRLTAGYEYNSITPRLVASASAGSFGTVDQWRHVALTYYCHASAGYLTLYVDGVAAVTWAGDTRIYKLSATSYEAASITGVYGPSSPGASGLWSNYCYVDDFLPAIDLEEAADAAPAIRRYLATDPNGAGALSQCTPVGEGENWEAAATADGDTSYNKSLTSGYGDLFTVAGITLPAEHGVRAVWPVAQARKTTAAEVTLKVQVKDASGTQQGAAAAIPTSYGRLTAARLNAQSNAAAWDEASVEASQVGYEFSGSFA